VANTWRARGKHVASTWQTRGEHVANTWRARGKHVASTWRARGKHVANTWRARGKHVASTWRARGEHVASTWQTRGEHVASTWQTRDNRVRHARPTSAARARARASAVRNVHCGRERSGHGTLQVCGISVHRRPALDRCARCAVPRHTHGRVCAGCALATHRPCTGHANAFPVRPQAARSSICASTSSSHRTFPRR
jgi:hypothetical protein